MLYRPDGQHEGKLFSTGKHTIEVPVPSDGEYVVEVRAHSEGGDGEVAQIKISGEQITSSFLPVLLENLGVNIFFLCILQRRPHHSCPKLER